MSAEPAVDPVAEVLRNYLFRGDDGYRGGPIGRVLGAEADAADIQDIADHVLRKQSGTASRFTSFSEEVAIALRFTTGGDVRFLRKVGVVALRNLAASGTVQLWTPDLAYDGLKAGTPKQRKQAADVRAAMRRNREILVEGQIPADAVERVQ